MKKLTTNTDRKKMKLFSFKIISLFFAMSFILISQNGVLNLSRSGRKHVETQNTVSGSPYNVAKLTSGDALTVEAWINPTTVSGTIRILDTYNWYDGWRLHIYNGSLRFQVYTGSGIGRRANTAYWQIPTNNWTHIAGTYDGSYIRIYIDGVEVARRSHSGNLALSSTPLKIGHDGFGSDYFLGQIDEVRVWNTVRSEAEINANKGFIIPTNSNNLLAYYRFDIETSPNSFNVGSDGLQNYSTSSSITLSEKEALHLIPSNASEISVQVATFPIHQAGMRVFHADAGYEIDEGDGLTFSKTDVGNTSTVDVKISNKDGEDALQISYISVNGSSAFRVNPAVVGQEISTGDSLTFTLEYSPTFGGTHSATARIFSNDPRYPEFDINLSGSTEIIFTPSEWVKINQPSITNTIDRTTMTVADYNGDGIPDMMISGSTIPPSDVAPLPSSSNTETRLYFGNGAGEFIYDASQSSLMGTRSNVVKSADVDNDGDIDIVLGGYLGNSTGNDGLVLFRNDGNGNMSEEIIAAAGYLHSSQGELEFADFDNDGDLDFVTSGFPGRVAYYENVDFLGHFVHRANIVNGSDFTETAFPTVSAADFDNDGDVDIFVSGAQEDGWYPSNAVAFAGIYVNDGHANFTLNTSNNFEEAGAAYSLAADFDNDGDIDIIHTGRVGGTYSRKGHLDGTTGTWYYRNLGGMNFSKIQGASINLSQHAALGNMAMGDIDNDGDIDLYISSGTQRLYLNQLVGGGSFTFSQFGKSFEAGDSFSETRFADIDGDRDLDIITAGGNNISVYRNDVNAGNNPPTKPNVLNAVEISHPTDPRLDKVQITWDGTSTDDITPLNQLSYDLKIRDLTSGNETVIAFPETNSRRSIPKYGKTLRERTTINRYIFKAGHEYQIGIGPVDGAYVNATDLRELPSPFVPIDRPPTLDPNLPPGWQNLSYTENQIIPPISMRDYVYDPDRNQEDDLVFTVIQAEPSELFTVTVQNDTNLVITLQQDQTIEQHGVGTLVVRAQTSGSSASTIDLAFNITVNNVPTAPRITSTPNNRAQIGILYDYLVEAEDPDFGATLTYAATLYGSASSWLSFNPSTRKLTGTPGIFQDGNSYNIRITVTDNEGLQAIQNFTITVDDENFPPVFSPETVNFTATEDVPFSQIISATDHDGNQLNYFIDPATSLPGWLNFNTSTHELSGTPGDTDIGSSSFKIVATDGGDDLSGHPADDTLTVNMTVSNVNDSVFIQTIGQQVTQEEVTKRVYVYLTDPDTPENYTINIVPENSNITLTGAIPNALDSLNQKKYLWMDLTPVQDFVGSMNIRFSVRDQGGVYAEENFEVVVTPQNDAPVITNPGNQSVDEDDSVQVALTFSDVDAGDTHTVSVVSNNTNVEVKSVENTSGTNYWLVAKNNFNGSVNITITVTDQGGLNDVENYTLTVNPVNNAPTFVSTGITLADEDAVYSYTPTVTDVDGDSPLTFEFLVTPSWITTTNVNTGEISGTPTNADIASNPHNVTLRVKDPSGAFSDQNFQITVNNTNDRPVITSTMVMNASENQLYSYVITATDEDVGDVLSYSAEIIPAWLSFNPSSQTLSGTPNNTHVGFHQVLLRVSDGQVNIDQGFTITVANTSDDPEFTSIAITNAIENSLYSYTVATRDSDQMIGLDNVSLSATVLPSWLNLSGNILSGTPSNSHVGNHSVTLTATDNLMNSTHQTFTISVANFNDAPVITSLPLDTAIEGTVYSYTITASDSDVVHGDILSYSAITIPTWLNFNSSTHILNGTPPPGSEGNHNIVLQVSDGDVNVQQAYTLVVIGLDDPPFFTTTAPTIINEGDGYIYTVDATDPDTPHDSLVFSATQIPGWLTFNPTTRVLSGVSGDAQGGRSYNITLSVTDGTTSVDQNFVINVTQVEDAPVFTSIPNDTAIQNNLYTYTVSATDADGDALTYSAPVRPAWLNFNPGTRVLSGTPTGLHYGQTYAVTIEVTDTKATVQQSFTIYVDEDGNNKPPKWMDPFTVNDATEKVAYPLTVTASDADDADNINITAVYLPSWLTLSGSGTSVNLNGTPYQADLNDTTVTLRVSNTLKPVSKDTTFYIHINPINDAPAFIPSNVTQNATENVFFSYTVAAVDSEGAALHYSVESLTNAAWLSFSPATRTISGTPDDAAISGGATSTVVIRATDPLSAISNPDLTVTINLTNVNDPPYFVSISDQTVDEGSNFNYTVNVDDIDNSSLTLNIVSAPTWLQGVANNAAKQFTFTNQVPNNADVGTHTVVLEVNDGTISVQNSFDITVNNTNDTPYFTSSPQTDATEDILYSFTVSASDSDLVHGGESLTFSALTKPAWLSFNATTGELYGTPTEAEAGNSYPVSIQVEDLASATSTLNFNITVQAVNDAPSWVATADTTVNEGDNFHKFLQALDIDNSSLTITALSKPNWVDTNSEAKSMTLTNGVTTLDDAHVGTYTLSFRVSDGEFQADQSFVLTVANVNEQPVISSTAPTNATENVFYSYTITASDVDVIHDDSLTYSATVLPDWLSFDPISQTLSGTPHDRHIFDKVGTHPVVLVVQDKYGLSATESFSIHVTNVNNPPEITSTAPNSINEGQLYSYTLAAIDSDNTQGELTFSAPTIPAWLSFNPSTHVLSGIPNNAEADSAYAITLMVYDGTDQDQEIFNLTVNNTNDAPTLVLSDTTINEDIAFSYTVNANDSDIIHGFENLTYTEVQTPSWLSFNALSRVLSGTPTQADVGVHTVSIRVEDMAGAFVTTTYTISVTNVNDAPVITTRNPALSVNEDTYYQFTLAASDVENDPITMSAPILPSWLTFNATTGLLSGTPTNDEVGNHFVKLKVEDGNSGEDSLEFTISVINVNDNPVWITVSDTTITEDTFFDITVSATDIDGDPLTYSSQNLGSTPWLSFDSSTRRLSGLADQADVGTHVITLNVFDGTLTVPLSFTITVTNVNDAPVFTSNPLLYAKEDSIYNFTAVATDEDGDTVTLSAVTLPSSGWLTFNSSTGLLTGTPRNDDVGINHIVLSATDGIENVSFSFDITVVNANDAPVITTTTLPDAQEDNIYTFKVLATDVDLGASLTFSIISSGHDWITINPANGTLSGQPDSTDIQTADITVQVSDGILTDQQVLSLTVIGVNDNPPVITSAAVTSVNEGSHYSYTVTAADGDGDLLNYSANIPVSAQNWLSFNPATQVFSGVPNNADVGTHTIEVSVSDGSFSDIQSFDLFVGNTNDIAEILSTPSLAATEDVLYSYQLTANDSDIVHGDNLTYSILVRPSWLTFNSVSGLLQGTPRNSDIGIHHVRIRVRDNFGVDVFDDFNITVGNVNDIPSLGHTPGTDAYEGQAYLDSITATDIDPTNDVLLYTLVKSPSWLSLINTNQLSGTPQQTDVGSDTVRLQIDDQNGGVITHEFVLTVHNTNDAPVVNSAPIENATEDLLYSYIVDITDEDGDALNYTTAKIPSWLSFNSGNKEFRGTPTNSDVNEHTTPDSVVLSINDGTVTVYHRFIITVANTNDAPSITSSPAASMLEDASYTYNVTLTDADLLSVGDSHTLITYGTTPAWVTVNGQSLEFNPPLNFNGGINVSFYVEDNLVPTLRDTQTFAFTVTAQNDAPQFTNTPYLGTIAQGAAYTQQLTATDPEGDPLSFSLQTAPAWLSINGSDQIVGTPADQSTVGDHNIVVQVTDGTATTTYSYTLTVTNTNDDPVITSSPITSTQEDNFYKYVFAGTDADGDGLTFSVTNNPASAWLSANADSLWGTPSNIHVGVYNNMTVQVDDGNGGIVTQIFNLTVTNVNDVPTISTAAVTAATEGLAYSYDVDATDDDTAHGDNITFSVSGNPTWLTIDANTGVLSGTPHNANVGTTGNITVTATDNQSAFDQQVFQITVTNTDDNPIITSIAVTAATEDVLYQYQVTAQDSDIVHGSETLTYSLAGQPSGMSINPATGLISWTPTNSDVGVHAGITVTVSDGDIPNATQTFTVTVSNVNDAPVFTGSYTNQTIDQGNALNYTVSASEYNDIDGDNLTLSFSGLPSWVTVSNDSILQGTVKNIHADDVANTITVTIEDPSGAQAQTTFTITAHNLNDAPVLTSDTSDVTIPTQNLYQYTISASDSDIVHGDVIDYNAVLVDDGGWLSYNDATRTLSGTPTQANNNATVTISATDNSLVKHEATFVITLDKASTNTPPGITSTPTLSTNEDELYTYVVGTSDPDAGDAIANWVVSKPAWLNWSEATRTFSGTPTNADVGTHAISITVYDLAGATANQSFDLKVINVNDAPRFTSNFNSPKNINEDNLYSYTVSANDIDGDILTYSVKQKPNFLNFNVGTRVLSGTPTNANIGSHIVTFNVFDGTVNVDSTFILSVANVNDAPVITSIAPDRATQNVPYSYPVSVIDSDVGDSIAYSISGDLDWIGGITSSGVIWGIPRNSHVNQIYSITVTVTDRSGASDIQTFTVSVDNVNDLPEFNSLPITSINEDQLYQYIVDVSDIDPGDVVTLTAQTLPAWLTLHNDTLRGTPLNEHVGVHAVVLRADDGKAYVEQTFNITVNNTNDAPEITSTPPAYAYEEQLYEYPVITEDQDGDALTVSIVSDTVGMWFSFEDDTLRGIPQQSDIGIYNVSIQVTDGQTVITQNFTIEVRNVNDVPVISVIPDQNISEDVPFTLVVNATDADGEVLSYNAIESANWLSFNPLTRTFSGTPLNSDAEQNYNVTVQVSDSSVTVSENFIIRVHNVNDAPVFTSVPNLVATEDQEYTYTPLVSDDDGIFGDQFKVKFKTFPVTADTTSGIFKWTPTNADVGGHFQVELYAVDLQNDTTFQSFTLSVNNTNDLPHFVGLTIVDTMATEKLPFIKVFSYDDIDVGDNVVMSVLSLPRWLTFRNDSLFGTPKNADSGLSSNLTLRLNDGTTTIDRNYRVSVQPFNDAPVIVNAPATPAAEGNPYSYTIAVNDSDNASFIITELQTPSWLSLSGMEYTGTPTNAHVGNHTIEFRVSDGDKTDQRSFTVEVQNVNSEFPVFQTTPIFTATEDIFYQYTFLATDADPGDSVAYVIAQKPSWLSIDFVARTLSGTPTNSDVGTHSVIINAIDNENLTTPQSFTITVVNQNDAPVIVSLPQLSVNENSTYSYTISATDVDLNDNISYSANTIPSWLSFNSATGVLNGTPANNHVGNHTVELIARDKSGASDIQNFNIAVHNTNDIPIITSSLDVNAIEDAAFSYTMTAHDSDAVEVLSYFVNNLPDWLQKSGAVLSNKAGRPNNDDVGVYTFEIGVQDDEGANSTAQLKITVLNSNDAPYFVSTPTATVLQDDNYSYTLSATDDDNDSLTYSYVSIPRWLSYNASTGVLSGTPTNDDVGIHNVAVRVTDGIASPVDQPFTIEVINVNDAPVIINPPVTFVLDTALEDYLYKLPLQAVDPDGDSLIYDGIPVASWTTLVFDSISHYLMGTPYDAHAGKLHNVVLRVMDEHGLEDRREFKIYVQNSNDKPIITSPANQNATQDIAYSYTVTAIDSDNAVLNYWYDTLPTWLGFDSTTHVLSGTPAWDDVGNHNVSLFVTDKQDTVYQNFTITVQNVNDFPVITNNLDTVIFEDALFSAQLNIEDLDGDPVAIAPMTLPSWLTYTGATRTISGTPTQTDVGNHSLIFDLDDGHGVHVQRGFTITVQNVNDHPQLMVLADQTATEDILFSYLISATDEDGDSLSYSFSSSPNVGLWLEDSLAGGFYLLHGVPRHPINGGNFTITVTVDDGNAQSQGSFTLTVNDINDVPVLITSIANDTTDEDIVYSETYTFSDEEGTALNYNLITSPTWLSITGTTANTMTLSGTPLNADAEKSTQVVFSYSDETNSDNASFWLRVNNVNDVPVITNKVDTITLQAINDSLTFKAFVNDPDLIHGDSITFTGNIESSNGSWLKFDDSSGILHGKAPAAVLDSVYYAHLYVTDKVGEKDSLFTFVKVVDTLHTPLVILPDFAKSMYEFETFHDTVLVNNFGDSLRTAIDVNPPAPWLKFGTEDTIGSEPYARENDSLNTIALWVEPDTTINEKHIGQYDVTLTVRDSFYVANYSFVFEVFDRNFPPYFTSDTSVNLAAKEDSLFNFTVTVADSDGVDQGNLTVGYFKKPDWLNYNSRTNTFSGTPTDGNYNLTDSLTYYVSDGHTHSGNTFVEQKHLITVTAVNDAPVFETMIDSIVRVQQTTDVNAERIVNIPLVATDIDGDAISYSHLVTANNASPTGWLNIVNNAGFHFLQSSTGHPLNAEVDTFALSVFAEDVGALRDTQNFTIIVEDVNDLFTFDNTPNDTIMNEGDLYHGFISASDIDVSQNLDTVQIVKPSWLTIINFSNSGNQLSFVLDGTPVNDADTVTHTVSITLTDGFVPQTYSFKISVNNVNDDFDPQNSISVMPKPTWVEDIAATSEFIVIDPEGDPLTYSFATAQPTGMTINPASGVISWMPRDEQVGVHNVVLRATDGFATIDTLYNFSVTNVNDMPQIAFVSNESMKDTQTKRITITGSDDDDSDNIIFSLATPYTWITATPNASVLQAGQQITSIHLDLNPTIVDTGVHVVRVQLSDGKVLAERSFSVTVTHDNVAPNFTQIPNGVAIEGQQFTQMAIAVDLEGQSITYSVSDTKGENILIDPANGTVTWIPSRSASENFSFDITATDSKGESTIVTSNITVKKYPVFDDSPLSNRIIPEDAVHAFNLDFSDGNTAENHIATVFSSHPSVVVQNASHSDYSSDKSLRFELNPASDFVGETTLTLSLRDTFGLEIQENFTVTVSDVNDAPHFTVTNVSDTVKQNENFSYHIDHSVIVDVDPNDSIIFNVAGLPGWLTFNYSTGILTGTVQQKDVNQLYSIIVTAEDKAGLSSSNNLRFDLYTEDINDAPEFIKSLDTIYVNEGSTFTEILHARDIDGDTLIFASNNLPNFVTITDSVISSNAVPIVNGKDSLIDMMFLVLDGKMLQNGKQAIDSMFTTLKISDVNLSPVITGLDSVTLYDFEIWRDTVRVVDNDGNKINLRRLPENLPDWLSHTIDTVNYTIALEANPKFKDIGEYDLQITALDNAQNPGSTVQNMDFNVVHRNRKPILVDSIAPLTAYQNENYFAEFSVVDVDIPYTKEKIQVDVSRSTIPAFLNISTLLEKDSLTKFSINKKELSQNDVGRYDIELIFTDASNYGYLDDTVKYELEVIDVNDAPYFVTTETFLIAYEDSVFAYQVEGADFENNPYRMRLVSNEASSWLNLDTTRNLLAGYPIETHITKDDETYSVEIMIWDPNDAQVDTNYHEFKIEVRPRNDAPFITSFPSDITLSTGEQFRALVEASDEDLIKLHYSLSYRVLNDFNNISDSLSSETNHGWISIGDESGIIAGTVPTNLNITSSDTVDIEIEIIVEDEVSEEWHRTKTDTSKFVMHVFGNTLPRFTFTNDTIYATEDSLFRYTLSSSLGTDDDGDRIYIQALRAPYWLTQVDSTLSGTPSQTDVNSGPQELILSISDEKSEVAIIDTMWVVVNNVNDRPILRNLGKLEIANSGRYVIDMKSYVYDEDGDEIEFIVDLRDPSPEQRFLRAITLEPMNEGYYQPLSFPTTLLVDSMYLDITVRELNTAERYEASGTLMFTIYNSNNIEIRQNVPNPFLPKEHGTTEFNYSITSDMNVTLGIYSIDGKLIKTLIKDTHEQGSYKADWDGRDNHGNFVPAGIYYFVLKAGNISTSKKLTIIR
jgi:hypothetical protein